MILNHILVYSEPRKLQSYNQRSFLLQYMETSTWTQSKKLLRDLEIIEHWTSTGILLSSLFHWGLGTLEEEEE